MSIIDTLAKCMLLQNPDIPAPRDLPGTLASELTDSRSLPIEHAGAWDDHRRWTDGKAVLNDRGVVVR